jgi:hypothetical protein
MKQFFGIGMIVFALTFCGLSEKLKKASSGGSGTGTSGPKIDTGGEPVDKPNPTAGQRAAVAGGESAKWAQQGIEFTLPSRWKKGEVDSKGFSYSSGDGGFLIVSISAMDASFPFEASIKAMYNGSKTRAANGEVDELHWLALDGTTGVQTREAMPEHKDSARRLQWQGYRKYSGQTQLINIILSSDGSQFDKHSDEFYGILYSTKIEQ